MKKKLILGAVGTIAAVTLFAGVVNADTTDPAPLIGESSIVINAGAITLDTVPSLTFEDQDITEDGFISDGEASDVFTITDLRGGDTGWILNAVASELTLTTGAYDLPVSDLTITPAEGGIEDSDVTGISGNIYQTEGTILKAGPDTNGKQEIDVDSSSLSAGEALKAGTYEGTITYTLGDEITE
ncbi:WxL domain-containing protein [Lactococcus insecticola]|nr:WxL domain-containing protein [Lactococcus insecticola]